MLCRNRQKFDLRIPWNNYYFIDHYSKWMVFEAMCNIQIWSERFGLSQPPCTWVTTPSNFIGWWLDTYPCSYDFLHPRVIMTCGKWIIKPINLRFKHIVTATLCNNMDFQPLLKMLHCLWVGGFWLFSSNLSCGVAQKYILFFSIYCSYQELSQI